MQSIPLEASLLRRQERLPRCLQPHRAVQPQLPEELSVSPDPGSPQPQSCFQARCLMPPGPPGGLVASQATPLVVRMGASESSPSKPGCGQALAFFVSLVSDQPLPAWVCILCVPRATIRLTSDSRTRLQQVQRGPPCLLALLFEIIVTFYINPFFFRIP